MTLTQPEMQRLEQEGERALEECLAFCQRLRNQAGALAMQGCHEESTRLIKKAERLERGSQVQIANALGGIRFWNSEAKREPVEHEAAREWAEYTRYAIDALALCRDLSSGTERSAHEAEIKLLETDWLELRGRYRDLTGVDLEPVLNTTEARKARRRTFGVPHSFEQRKALLAGVAQERDGTSIRLHTRLMLRAEMKLPGSNAEILAHRRASVALGRLAPQD